jgi:hypothetical protein
VKTPNELIENTSLNNSVINRYKFNKDTLTRILEANSCSFTSQIDLLFLIEESRIART